MAKSVAYIGGFLTTNIGNAFYDEGILYALKSNLPNYQIYYIADQPENYWLQTNKEKRNKFNYLDKINVDYIVIAGPLFTKRFPDMWLDTLKKLQSKGTKIVFLSAGFTLYDNEEIQLTKNLLETIQPHAISTRDRHTFNIVKNHTQNCHDGICFAFYISDYFKPYSFSNNPYVILTFDNMPEPHFNTIDNTATTKTNTFLFKNKKWEYTYSSFNVLDKILIRFHIYSGFTNESFGTHEIIRPTNSLVKRNIFNKEKTFASDVFTDYLNLISHSACIFSDRVHTCVAGLALGKPAMLFSNTPRAKLLDRVGAKEIKTKPVTLDSSLISEEKIRLSNFIKSTFLYK
jgi:hypothetical protein